MNGPGLPFYYGEPLLVRDQLDLVATRTAAGYARAFTGLALAKWGAGPVQDDALLVVSELVTNAVTATTTALAEPDGLSLVTVRLLGLRASVVIEVWDLSTARPAAKEPDEESEGGRGLLLVGSLASRWGSYTAGGGKAVWAELPFVQPHSTEPTTQPRPWRRPATPYDLDLLHRVLAGLHATL
ncbi:ATP-binding protein [Streptomyces lichenis]|uniref:ATP-binding protein n=1 Tax=Streptomyces lichenis TaxID=2306967 RepID=A0ABT0I969_9ACTN|nr:ATP-binding protein [Streptomyces lichenis]MCK8677844.1 ATP-binding protein [Streptomyces lichenis]